MTLHPNSTLQGGKYKIIKVLGQGGFGITYLAEQTMLERKIAIKEFFMKEFCERDETTSHVTMGTAGARATVDRFREKFLKEARNIAKLKHPHIIQILDVFEENGTAYYVMEYAENGSLSTLVADNKALPEAQATRYILQVADALAYIHQRKMNHLDIKPSNIMLNGEDETLLIDFGLSKQYDEVGQQTSTTPVGLSEGYAPMEQYKQGGVKEFSPETDIYALGATFFKLLTGKTPPGASDVNEDGLPIEELESNGVSQAAIDAITKAMEPRRKKRMHDVKEFANLLSVTNPQSDSKEEESIDEEEYDEPYVEEEEEEKETESAVEESQEETEYYRDEDASRNVEPTPEKHKDSTEVPKSIKEKNSYIIGYSIFGIIVICLCVMAYNKYSSNNVENDIDETKTKIEDDAHVQAKVDPIDNAFDSTPRTFTVDGVSFKMIKVDGGTFQMGATSEQGSDAGDSEKPVHNVTLSCYYIGQTEVTQALWKAVMGFNPSYHKGDNLPVETVSWEDCQTFIAKLNKLTGQKFRLPTEAEWEYAARGGNKSNGYKYSGSNDIDIVAWYKGNSGCKTHPVATKQPNELGLYDMSGNVYEWCQDWYDDKYYSNSPATNPTGPSSGSCRVFRDGTNGDIARWCRVSNRFSEAPSERGYGYFGFRLALSAR